jgi:hypothetical protein
MAAGGGGFRWRRRVVARRAEDPRGRSSARNEDVEFHETTTLKFLREAVSPAPPAA